LLNRLRETFDVFERSSGAHSAPGTDNPLRVEKMHPSESQTIVEKKPAVRHHVKRGDGQGNAVSNILS